MSTTAEPTPKHVLTIAPQHVWAFRKLNQALAEFLNQAFEDERNFAQIRVDLMLGLVAEKTLQYLETIMHSEPEPLEPGTQECSCHLDPLDVAYERYVEQIGGHSEPAVSQIPPVALDLISKERFDFILKAHGLHYPDLPFVEENGDPNIVAWNAARAGRRRELQRVGALFFLGWQIPGETSGILRKRVEDEGWVALEYLVSRAAEFHETEKTLAPLIGGEALKLTKADMLKAW
jgi:hypothetical protein